MRNRVKGIAGKTILFSHYFARLEVSKLPQISYAYLRQKLGVFLNFWWRRNAPGTQHFGSFTKKDAISEITININTTS